MEEHNYDMINAFLQMDDFEFLDDPKATEDQNNQNPPQTNYSSNTISYPKKISSSSSSTSRFISFGDNQKPILGDQDSMFSEHGKEVMMTSAGKMKISDHNYGSGVTTMTAVTPIDAFGHVVAERRRRERLNELMAALSSIIPGLKRNDKCSVLGEAVRYLKDQQERVKQLEKQDRKNISEKIVLLGGYDQSSEEHSSSRTGKSRFDIEARISENNVLIKVHCEKKKGLLIKMIKEIEKNGLVTVNSSLMPFGNYSMDMTIVAQLEMFVESNCRGEFLCDDSLRFITKIEPTSKHEVSSMECTYSFSFGHFGLLTSLQIDDVWHRLSSSARLETLQWRKNLRESSQRNSPLQFNSTNISNYPPSDHDHRPF